ncbi:uncharacterized protein JCM6883_002950 [Sporobolomyces salmoneus]|uniref:uncharacterized protein n=1 Tax=Sporobolomyces salmoneus TaxID=183962 RepID=UPI003176EA79
MGTGPKLLERLLANNTEETIATVQNFWYDAHVTGVTPLLKKFIERASNLEHVFINPGQKRQFPPLKALFGSSITTLSLKCVNLRINGAVFSFPELIRLCFENCSNSETGGILFQLPKLKHLAWFSHGSTLFPPEFKFIDRFAPQLDSFMAYLISRPALPPSIFSRPSLSVLFHQSYRNHVPDLDGVRNLYFELRRGVQDADLWIQSIDNLKQHQLETLTLALLQGTELSLEAQVEIDELEEVCKAKGIEVIWEERTDQNTFYNRVPASFIHRAESRRQTTKKPVKKLKAKKKK